MIETIQLQGTEKQLYQLIAPLVMDANVLRKNNNYPFKTSDTYVWFIAVDGKQVVGFLPVERRDSANVINNYYIGEKGEELLSLLLIEAISALGADKPLLSVTLTEHQPVFAEQGFEVEKEWKRYVKMRRK